MMSQEPFSPEQLWDAILSREADRILSAYHSLAPEEKVDVRIHLARMASEPDWHPEQVRSAVIALEIIQGLVDE